MADQGYFGRFGQNVYRQFKTLKGKMNCIVYNTDRIAIKADLNLELFILHST